MPTDGFFVKAFHTFYDTFVAKQDAFNGPIIELVKTFTAFVGTYLMCWIIYRGYQILWGRNQDNIKDFAWDAFIRFIFAAICFFPDEWLRLISASLKEFHELKIGNQWDFIQYIQDYFNKSILIAKKMAQDGSWYEVLYIGLMIIMVMLGTLAGCFYAFKSYILNYIGFVFLLALTPLALMSLIFGNFLKDTFKNWWGLMLSSCLTLVLLNAFGIGIFTYVNNIYFKETSKLIVDGSSNYLLIAFIALFTGGMITSFVKIIINLVEKMVGTSIESTVNHAALSVGSTIAGGAGIGALASRFGAKYGFRGAKIGASKAYQGSKKLIERFKRGKEQWKIWFFFLLYWHF